MTEAWETASEEQLQAVVAPLKRSLSESKNPAREADLKRALAAIDSLLAQAQ